MNRYNRISGTVSEYGVDIYGIPMDKLDLSENDLDRLLGRIMEHTTKVILPCKYCGSHNAFSNPTCIKYGAPMGGISYA